MLADDEVDRILVVSAHPDDVDFGAAGTVATWTDAGIEVAYCVVTDGQAGGFDPDLPRDRIPAIRRDEQRAAAAIVGVEDVTFLGYEDGRLTAGLDLRRDLARQIRRIRPQRVVLQSPERDWERIQPSHPDHMAAGEAAMAAVYPDSRNPFAFPELLEEEGLDPHTVEEVWVTAGPVTDHHVDVTGVVDRKLAAIAAHESQLPGGIGELEERVRGWLARNARDAGLPEGRYAETFRVVPAV